MAGGGGDGGAERRGYPGGRVHCARERREAGLSREPVDEPERWRQIRLEGATSGFERRDTPAAERDHERVPEKGGELTMKLVIVAWFLEERPGRDLRKWRRARGSTRFRDSFSCVTSASSRLSNPDGLGRSVEGSAMSTLLRISAQASGQASLVTFGS